MSHSWAWRKCNLCYLWCMVHFCCGDDTGQTSGAAAGFCCPLLRAGYAGNWLTSTYYDAGGVEGAHSCLALYFGGAMSYQAANAFCGTQTYGAASHLVTSMQTSAVDVSGTSAGAMSQAAKLAYQYMGGSCGGGSSYTVGANATTLSTQATGWTWIDGTTATNLNCAVQSCGMWDIGEPK